MKAIITRYLSFTNRLPARIKTSAEGVSSTTLSLGLLERRQEEDPALKGLDPHVVAAKLFAKSFGWGTDLASGQLANRDWVHCFIPDTHTRKPETPPENPEDSHGWRCVVKHLFDTLKANGIEVVSVDNSGGVEKLVENPADFINEAVACDECDVYVNVPVWGKRCLYLVYGNEPFELVADYQTCPRLDEVLTAWSDTWEGTPLIRKPFPPAIPTV